MSARARARHAAAGRARTPRDARAGCAARCPRAPRPPCDGSAAPRTRRRASRAHAPPPNSALHSTSRLCALRARSITSCKLVSAPSASPDCQARARQQQLEPQAQSRQLLALDRLARGVQPRGCRRRVGRTAAIEQRLGRVQVMLGDLARLAELGVARDRVVVVDQRALEIVAARAPDRRAARWPAPGCTSAWRRARTRARGRPRPWRARTGRSRCAGARGSRAPALASTGVRRGSPDAPRSRSARPLPPVRPERTATRPG